MSRLCKYCNKEFEYSTRNVTQQFCSKDCGFKYRTIKIEKVCKGCGITFKLTASESKVEFCTRKCYNKFRKKNSIQFKEIRKCKQCDKEFEAYRPTMYFCSSACSTTANNNLGITGYAAFSDKEKIKASKRFESFTSNPEHQRYASSCVTEEGRAKQLVVLHSKESQDAANIGKQEFWNSDRSDELREQHSIAAKERWKDSGYAELMSKTASATMKQYHKDHPLFAIENAYKMKKFYVQGWHKSPKCIEVFYKSSYELAYYEILDNDPKVVSYKVDKLFIEYFNPISNTIKRYWPDLVVEYIDGHTEVIEVKPKKFLDDQVIVAKATAAFIYCTKQINMIFRFITEDHSTLMSV
jgi:hypothetical protein